MLKNLYKCGNLRFYQKLFAILNVNLWNVGIRQNKASQLLCSAFLIIEKYPQSTPLQVHPRLTWIWHDSDYRFLKRNVIDQFGVEAPPQSTSAWNQKTSSGFANVVVKLFLGQVIDYFYKPLQLVLSSKGRYQWAIHILPPNKEDFYTCLRYLWISYYLRKYPKETVIIASEKFTDKH